MEEELDELRSENLNLRINLGDLENARGFNDLREPLEMQQGYTGKRCCCGERRGNTISVQSVLSTYGAQRAAPEVMWTKAQQRVMERTIKWKLQSGGKAFHHSTKYLLSTKYRGVQGRSEHRMTEREQVGSLMYMHWNRWQL
jgi:hypothetical protein